MSDEDATLSGKAVTDNNGGQVRFGVNSKAHPEAVEAGFYTMLREAALIYAEDLFKYDYWSMILGYAIQEQIIASKIANLAFNCGPPAANKILQRAVNSLRAANAQIAADGICGDLTIAAVNTYLDDTDVEALYAAIIV